MMVDDFGFHNDQIWIPLLWNLAKSELPNLGYTLANH